MRFAEYATEKAEDPSTRSGASAVGMGERRVALVGPVELQRGSDTYTYTHITHASDARCIVCEGWEGAAHELCLRLPRLRDMSRTLVNYD